MTTLNLEQILAPVKAINELTIRNAEILLNDQVKLLEENTRAGFAVVKEAAQIKDLKGYNAFVTEQVNVTRAKIEALPAQAKAYAEQGKAYADEVREIVQGAVAV